MQHGNKKNKRNKNQKNKKRKSAVSHELIASIKLVYNPAHVRAVEPLRQADEQLYYLVVC